MHKSLDRFKVRALRCRVQFILLKHKLIKARAKAQIGKKVMNLYNHTAQQLGNGFGE